MICSGARHRVSRATITRLFLVRVVCCCFYCCAALQPHLTRRRFGTVSSLTFAPSWLSNQGSFVTFPLQFLPMGGCWALKVSIGDKSMNGFSYLAIVDTGSPFLTAPDQSLEMTDSTKFSSSFEQYGELSGIMDWRKANYVTLFAEQNILLDRTNIVLGVPSSEVIENAGGIFVGLIWKDDNRPTFLQQYGFISMRVDFVENQLKLSRQHLLRRSDPTTCVLFNLQSYGPDLYHYAVLCNVVELQYVDEDGGNSVKTLSLDPNTFSRPIVAVLDTGLTGCILSDSFQTIEGVPVPEHIVGACVTIKTMNDEKVRISSCEQYWRLSLFQLPWFYDDDRHPHIIAMGNTFWKNTKSLSIDPSIGRFTVEL